MTNTKKNIALVSAVVASVAFGLIIGMSIQISEAQMSGGITEKRVGPMAPKSFGSIHQGPSPVCGDQLCNEPVTDIGVEDSDVTVTDSDPAYSPTLELNGVNIHRPSSARTAQPVTVMYSVTCGEMNLQNIIIEAASDLESESYSVGSCVALKTSQNVARIMAIDPDSIHIEISGYQLAPPTGDPRRG